MKKSLLHTNPYLRDPKIRDEMIIESALTSTAVEGVHMNLRKKIVIKFKTKKKY